MTLNGHIFNVLDEVFVQDAVDNSRYNLGELEHWATRKFLGTPRYTNIGLLLTSNFRGRLISLKNDIYKCYLLTDLTTKGSYTCIKIYGLMLEKTKYIYGMTKKVIYSTIQEICKCKNIHGNILVYMETD